MASKIEATKRSVVLSCLLLVVCASGKCARVSKSPDDLSVASLPDDELLVNGLQSTDALNAECCKGGKCVRNEKTGKNECECPPGQGWYFTKGTFRSVSECRECGCGGPHFNCTFSCFLSCTKTCVCGQGYMQRNGMCEVMDPCLKKPCRNGGTCIPGERLKYTCVCPPTHTGNTCETTIDPCQRQPCKNGGTCIPSNDSDYTCLCPATHTGNICEKVKTTFCLPNPCENGGNCSLLDGGGYLCACPKWYSGKNCHQNKWCVEGPGRFLCKSGTCSFDHEKEQGYCRCTQNRELSPAEAMLLKSGRR